LNKIDIAQTQKDLEELRAKKRLQIGQTARTLSADKIEKVVYAHYPESTFSAKLDGLCFGIVIHFAKQHQDGKSWREIARACSAGAPATAASNRMILNALSHFPNPHTVLKHIAVQKNDLNYEFVKVNGVDKPNWSFRTLSSLANGVYELEIMDKRHSILLSVEGNDIYIMDPNIGLLYCKKAKLQTLLKKIQKNYQRMYPQFMNDQVQVVKLSHNDTPDIAKTPTLTIQSSAAKKRKRATPPAAQKSLFQCGIEATRKMLQGAYSFMRAFE
jgi:hypothetical protein